MTTKVVPRQATIAMVQAGMEIVGLDVAMGQAPRLFETWRAMYDAAPAPAAPADDDLVARLRILVEAQAADPGLWFVAKYASEAYLQQALRELHAMIEEDSHE